jgi:hypothetical protein
MREVIKTGTHIMEAVLNYIWRMLAPRHYARWNYKQGFPDVRVSADHIIKIPLAPS